MNESLKKFLYSTAYACEKYLKDKMDEKERAGFIISREIIEEILKELKESFPTL